MRLSAITVSFSRKWKLSCAVPGAWAATSASVVVGAPDEALAGDYFGVLLQYPGTTGEIVDYRALIAKLRAKNGCAKLGESSSPNSALTPCAILV